MPGGLTLDFVMHLIVIFYIVHWTPLTSVSVTFCRLTLTNYTLSRIEIKLLPGVRVYLFRAIEQSLELCGNAFVIFHHTAVLITFIHRDNNNTPSSIIQYLVADNRRNSPKHM